MDKKRTFSCGTNAGNPQRSRVANQNALLLEGQCYVGSMPSLSLFTCRVRKQLKRLGDFSFLAIAYFPSVLFLWFSIWVIIY